MIKNIVMIRKVLNLISLVRENAFIGLYNRIKQWTWKSIEYTVLKKSISSNEPEPINDGFEFRKATEADIPWLIDNMSHLGEKGDKVISQQFKGNGFTILGSTLKNNRKLVFSALLSYDEFAFTLLQSSIMVSDLSIRRIWVPPSMRKQGLATLGMKYAVHIASQVGSNNIWSFVKESNIPSVKLHKNHGYVTYGHIRLLTRFGFKYAKVKKIKEKRWEVYPIHREISKL